jgi:hypothetical protein
MKLNW